MYIALLYVNAISNKDFKKNENNKQNHTMSIKSNKHGYWKSRQSTGYKQLVKRSKCSYTDKPVTYWIIHIPYRFCFPAREITLIEINLLLISCSYIHIHLWVDNLQKNLDFIENFPKDRFDNWQKRIQFWKQHIYELGKLDGGLKSLNCLVSYSCKLTPQSLSTTAQDWAQVLKTV